MGLTGAILSARFRLIRTATAYYDVTYRRTANVDETLEIIAQTDAQYRYSVAWIDCLARGKSLGRSVLMLGNDAEVADLPAALRLRPLTAAGASAAKTVPCQFPAFALNSWTVKAFNALYYATHASCRKFVDYDTFFYPLDGVLHWNRIYGRRGFVQYQALFPPETSRRAPDRPAGTHRRFATGLVPGRAQEQRAGRFGNALLPARRPHPGAGFPLHGSGSASTAGRVGPTALEVRRAARTWPKTP